MKSLNAKRIAAIAASLAVGLAFAGPVSFSNIPIINNAGQPVVQIVVGSTAQPSDGVVAANIAAVIGNLAYTSTPVTATVGNTGAVTCAVTTPSCTLSNQQVYLGEKGLVVSSGSYAIKGLIGSILNNAVLNYGTISSSKTLNNTGAYSFPESPSPYSITTPSSPLTGIYSTGVIAPTTVTASLNGGGLSFSSFSKSNSSGTYFDNIVKLSNAQLPGLMNGAGPNSESEYLYLMGFPVYDQATNNFAVLDASGIYEAIFGSPISVSTSSGATNHAALTLLGQSWTIYNAIPPTVSSYPSSSQFVVGGKLQLAQSMTPLETVYVGHNITSGPFTVVLQDLSYPNSTGISNAAIAVYKNGAGPYNETEIVPGTTATLNVAGTPLYVYVSQTFPGLYAYQKWAKIQLFSNIVNMTNGKAFNNQNPGWLVGLRWSTNQSTAPTSWGNDATLQGIVLYANTSNYQTLTPGSSFDYITNPAIWKATFLGDSLGAPGSGNTNYDTLSFTTGTGSGPSGTSFYENAGTQSATAYTWDGSAITPNGAPKLEPGNETAITEPTNLFTVTSQIPTAFSVTHTSPGTQPTSSLSTLTYILDTYSLSQLATFNAPSLSTTPNSGSVLALENNGVTGNYPYTSSNPLTIEVSGYIYGVSGLQTVPFQFNSLPGSGVTLTNSSSKIFYNITNIQLPYAFPYPGVKVTLYDSANTVYDTNTVIASDSANAIALATLNYVGPALAYTVPPNNYESIAINPTVQYTGESTPQTFTLTQAATAPTSLGRYQYFTYIMPELVTPTATSATANTQIGITNASTMAASPGYWLNMTGANNNALTYYSSQGNNVKALPGFRTERGSEVAAISTTSLTYDMAKSVDTLNFLVGPANTTLGTTVKTYGPFGVGQATNIPNVTIANVTATCTFSSTSCSVKGLSNLTATPSVTSA
ncbi:MAG: S-layer protein, partial [Candidatus Micrarchaeaceae archaeon]